MLEKGPIFILSIDGGGSRGVIPVNVLNFIEREEETSIRKEFDFFAGVSTGALVAAYLGQDVGSHAESAQVRWRQQTGLY